MPVAWLGQSGKTKSALGLKILGVVSVRVGCLIRRRGGAQKFTGLTHNCGGHAQRSGAISRHNRRRKRAFVGELRFSPAQNRLLRSERVCSKPPYAGQAAVCRSADFEGFFLRGFWPLRSLETDAGGQLGSGGTMQLRALHDLFGAHPTERLGAYCALGAYRARHGAEVES